MKPEKSPPAKARKKSSTKRPAPAPAIKVLPGLPPVPALLFEPDPVPAKAPASGPVQRFASGSPPASESPRPAPPIAPPAPSNPAPAPQAQASSPLPEAYGTRKLLLAARDPHCLYAHWDLTREQQNDCLSRSRDHHLVLRVFVDRVAGSPLAQVRLQPDSNHWFVNIPYACTMYQAQLGYFSHDGGWNTVSTSDTAITPPDSPSADITALFATIPFNVPATQLLELARAAIRDNIPLSEILQQLRLYSLEFPDDGGEWTPERERALAELIALETSRRVSMSSFEISELIRRQPAVQASSEAGAQFSAPVSAGISSDAGPAQGGRSFWFNLNAELIVYGATEPDARVTIAGLPIQLRPDGSFSFRYSLPDGEYQLPASAVAADGADIRCVQLKFARGTDYQGGAGIHPQDPALRPPSEPGIP